MSPSTLLMMGVSLAAATGIRGGLPLLLTVAFARTGQIGFNPHFAFLTTDTAVAVLMLAALIEIVGDLIPGVNHTLDVLHTMLRPAAATLIIAGLLVELPPIVGVTVGLAVGASISAFVHTVKAAGRGLISAATFGIANMLMSLLENIVVGLYALFALVAPAIVFVLTLIFLGILLFIARRLWKRMCQGANYVKRNLAALLAPQPQATLNEWESEPVKQAWKEWKDSN